MTEHKLHPFLDLWKKNDSEWMKQRGNDWKILKNNRWFSRSTRKNKKITKDYFFYGCCLEYIPCSNLYLLAPIETKEENRKFFFSDVFTENDRNDLIFDFGGYNRALLGVDWAQKRSKLHILSILKSKDNQIETINSRYGKITTLNDEISNFCNHFLASLKSYAITTSLDECIDHTIIYDWLDYLLDVLHYANDPEYLRKNVVDQLFNNVNLVIDSPQIVATNSYYDWNTKLVDENKKVKTLEDITRIYADELPDVLPSSIKLAHYLKEKEEEIRKNWYYNRIKS